MISMISFSYFKHGVSAWLLVILPIFEAISLMFLYKKNVIDFIFKASVLSYMFIVIYFVLNNGFMALFTTIYNQLFDNSSIMTVLEAHEITYVFGILFIYYIDDFKNNN